MLKKLAGIGAVLALLFGKKATKFIARNVFNAERHPSEDDVKDAISAYLDGQMTLQELDEWLTLRTWDNPRAPSLAHEAELLIVEAGRGDRDDLAQELRALAAGKRAEPAVS